MPAKPGEHQESTVRETAARFLEAVKNGDSRTFWDSLDKKGQGYFLGIWFYAMESMKIETIIKLTEEDVFIDGVLGPIITGLRDSMGGLLNNPLFGEVLYRTQHTASVRVSPAQDLGPDSDEVNYIPLVLELSDTGEAGGGMNFTCWKIDTLQCFQLNRSTH